MFSGGGDKLVLRVGWLMVMVVYTYMISGGEVSLCYWCWLVVVMLVHLCYLHIFDWMVIFWW